MVSKKQDASGVAPLNSDQGDLYRDPLTKSNILNEHYQSVFTDEDFSTMAKAKHEFISDHVSYYYPYIWCGKSFKKS